MKSENRKHAHIEDNNFNKIRSTFPTHSWSVIGWFSQMRLKEMALFIMFLCETNEWNQRVRREMYGTKCNHIMFNATKWEGLNASKNRHHTRNIFRSVHCHFWSHFIRSQSKSIFGQPIRWIRWSWTFFYGSVKSN